MHSNFYLTISPLFATAHLNFELDGKLHFSAFDFESPIINVNPDNGIIIHIINKIAIPMPDISSNNNNFIVVHPLYNMAPTVSDKYNNNVNNTYKLGVLIVGPQMYANV